MNNSRIIDELRSSNATLIVLVLALCAQIPHAADVFRLLVPLGDGCAIVACVGSYVHSYLFAVALEMAVLLFVVRGKERESYAFAVVSVAMNLAYYGLHSVALFSMMALPAWLVSVALPSAIALYSHVVADGKPEQPERKPRAVKTVHQSDRTEQLSIYEPEQSEQLPVIEAQPLNELAEQTDEQKRRYLEQVLATTDKPNKTALARELGIGRTTLYAWISELQPAEANT